MAEWSKGLVSGTSHFDGVGSNPTPVMIHCYKLTVLLADNQFENIQQHTFSCIDYIGRMAEWSEVLVSGTSHFNGVGLNLTLVMLHCYKLTVFGCRKDNSKILNNIASTVLTILALWLSGLSFWFQVRGISMAWVPIPLLSCYTLTNYKFYFHGNNSKIINNIPSTVLAGWLSGLNPTPVMPHS